MKHELTNCSIVRPIEGDVMAQLELVAEKEQIEAEERHQVLLEIARCQNDEQHNKEA
jgi:hypothetical protein